MSYCCDMSEDYGRSFFDDSYMPVSPPYMPLSPPYQCDNFFTDYNPPDDYYSKTVPYAPAQADPKPEDPNPTEPAAAPKEEKLKQAETKPSSGNLSYVSVVHTKTIDVVCSVADIPKEESEDEESEESEESESEESDEDEKDKDFVPKERSCKLTSRLNKLRTPARHIAATKRTQKSLSTKSSGMPLSMDPNNKLKSRSYSTNSFASFVGCVFVKISKHGKHKIHNGKIFRKNLSKESWKKLISEKLLHTRISGVHLPSDLKTQFDKILADKHNNSSCVETNKYQHHRMTRVFLLDRKK